MTTTQTIRAAIENSSYRYFGLRIDVTTPGVAGDVCRPSRRWENNDLTDEILPGTSVLLVEADTVDAVRAALDPYFGEWLVLLGSDEWQLGEDDGEILLVDAEILAVVRSHGAATVGPGRFDQPATRRDPPLGGPRP